MPAGEERRRVSSRWSLKMLEIQKYASNTNTNTHGKTRNTQIQKYRHTQIQILLLGVSARSEEERIEIFLQKVVSRKISIPIQILVFQCFNLDPRPIQGTSTSTKLGGTPTGQSKCVGWKRTLLAWCTMRLARPMLCLSQVQTLSLSLSKPLKTWNWTKWRAESSRKLLPLLRPQCELVSILFNYQKMTVHCQLPSYVVLYLLNSVVIAKDM